MPLGDDAHLTSTRGCDTLLDLNYDRNIIEPRAVLPHE